MCNEMIHSDSYGYGGDNKSKLKDYFILKSSLNRGSNKCEILRAESLEEMSEIFKENA